MFTVKHVTPMRADGSGGSERLYAATNVMKERLRAPDERDWRDGVTVVLIDGGLVNIDSGTVFVMNESGATVSRWDINAPVCRARSSKDKSWVA